MLFSYIRLLIIYDMILLKYLPREIIYRILKLLDTHDIIRLTNLSKLMNKYILNLIKCDSCNIKFKSIDGYIKISNMVCIRCNIICCDKCINDKLCPFCYDYYVELILADY